MFICYHPDAEASLGRALSNGDHVEYFQEMKRLLSNPRTPGAYADLAMQIFERYRDHVSSRESAWFGNLVSRYRKNKVSRDGLLEWLELFAIRLSDWQTADQTLFAPYPRELVPNAYPEQGRDYRKAPVLP